jgi:hypothetical protein
MALSGTLQAHVDALFTAAKAEVDALTDAKIVRDRAALNVEDVCIEAIKHAVSAEDFSDLVG